MFGWWKRNDGFEWREYVRTTILMRRQRRRDKLVDAKEAAMAGLKDAGKKGAKAGAAGLSAVGAASGSVMARLATSAVTALAAIGRWPVRLLGPLGPGLTVVARTLAQPNVRGPVLPIGGIGLAAATYRTYTMAFDREAMIASGLGLAALALCALPLAANGKFSGWLMPAAGKLPATAPAVAGGVVVTVLAVLAGYGAARTMAPQGTASLLSNLPSLPLSITNPLAASKPVEGRASALSGDTLRVSNVVLRLAGIEAPIASSAAAPRERRPRVAVRRRSRRCPS